MTSPIGAVPDPTERSDAIIEIEDLKRIAELALSNLRKFFDRNQQTRALYGDRMLALCLCQGAAEHFVRPGRGVKDFDAWAFYSEHPVRPFPYRRRGNVDFGQSKFGRHPDDDGFFGRRIDVIGRSIPVKKGDSSFEAICAWIRRRRVESAKFLARRPVVIIYPEKYVGTVIWDPAKEAPSHPIF